MRATRPQDASAPMRALRCGRDARAPEVQKRNRAALTRRC